MEKKHCPNCGLQMVEIPKQTRVYITGFKSPKSFLFPATNDGYPRFYCVCGHYQMTYTPPVQKIDRSTPRYIQHGELRFERREVIVDRGDTAKHTRILQQRCLDTETMQFVWIDVPMVNEEILTA